MDILIKVLQFFLCFTLLVGVHEFGHFITARIFKMRVEKFYILFNPWFSIFKFKRGETEYGLGWLPLGGYCKISGMIDESMDKEQMALPPQPYEFRSKPAWQRFIVMVAGVVMNILTAIVIYIAVCFTWGESYLPTDQIKWGYEFNESGHAMGFEDGDKILSIDGEQILDFAVITNRLLLSDGDRTVVVERDGEEVTINIPLEQLIEVRQNKGYTNLLMLRMPFIIDSIDTDSAKASGLQPGDEVVAINGVKKDSYAEYRKVIEAEKSNEISLSVLRGADTLSMPIAVNEEGRIGVVTRIPFVAETRSYTLLESIPAGFSKAGATITSYADQMAMIFQPKTEMYKELGGFVAIGSMFSGAWDWMDFWLKTAFLSIILAVMNILPIPGLDGGHALFTLYEMVTRHKPSDKFLEITQYVGMGLLFALLLYANGNDFYRLIFG